MTLAFGSAKLTATQSNGTGVWADVPGLAVTLVTGASRLRISLFGGQLFNSTTNDYAELTFSVDGADIEGGLSDGLESIFVLSANAPVFPVAVSYITPALAAGSHTVKARLRGTAGTASIGATTGQPVFLYVEELPF